MTRAGMEDAKSLTPFEAAVLRVRRLSRSRDAPALIAELTSTLERPGLTVRAIAARHLGKIRAPQAVEYLIAMLQEDHDPDVRMTAAYALGEIGRSDASHALISALADSDHTVRKSAGEALGKMRERGAVEPLMELLQDADRDTARVAAKALIRIGDRKATPSLREFARSEKSPLRRRKIKAAVRSMEKDLTS